MLFGSSILEVLIGVLFLFLLLSMIVSAVTELISQALALRSRTLYDALSTMLFDEKARDALFDHPLIKSLSQQNWFDKLRKNDSRPSYIPSNRLAQALLETFQVGFDANGALQFTAPANVPMTPELEQLLHSLAQPITGVVADVQELGVQTAKWFDETMERVTGWYRRKTQLVIVAVGALIVITGNANVLTYAQALLVNPTARAAVVGAAEAAVASPAPDESPAPSGTPEGPGLTTGETIAELQKLDFAIGWDATLAATDSRHTPASLDEAIAAVSMNWLGWLLTTGALSMGAPFWFDLLKQAIGLRTSGLKPKSTTRDDED